MEPEARPFDFITTRELLEEVSLRMKTTQNSLKGEELGDLAREACLKLSSGVLDFQPKNVKVHDG